MKHAKHKDLGTAYLFYYATDVGLSPSSSQGGEDKVKDLLKKRLNGLVNDCLVIAKEVSLGRVFPTGPNRSLMFCTTAGRIRRLQRADDDG